MNLIHNPPQCLLAGSTAHQGFTRPFSSAIADRELAFLSSSASSPLLRERERERESFYETGRDATAWIQAKTVSGEDDGLLCKHVSIMEYRGGVEIGRLIFHCCAKWPISSLLISNGSILILLISHRRGISFRFVRDVWLITRPFETRIPVEEGFICVSFYLFIYVCGSWKWDFCASLYDNSICIREFIWAIELIPSMGVFKGIDRLWKMFSYWYFMLFHIFNV